MIRGFKWSLVHIFNVTHSVNSHSMLSLMFETLSDASKQCFIAEQSLDFVCESSPIEFSSDRNSAMDENVSEPEALTQKREFRIATALAYRKLRWH